ncbi:MAG TPA: hypothetical protein VGE01_07930 [Fimbriimonas sp.]
MSTTLSFPIRSDRLSMNVQATEHLLHRQTEYQTIDIYQTEVFGRTLLLDGHIQLTEFDERSYHEALVQVPLLSIAAPRNALIVGGGDGGVLREICRHASIRAIDMVEIDRGVIEASKEHLPFLSAGAFEDPRLNLVVGDAFPFVKQADRKYDLIVIDATDVYEEEEGELSEMLFTSEFYEDCRNALSPKGIVVTQADNLVFCPYSMEAILKEFTKVFQRTGRYQALVPSFGGFSGYVWGSVGAEISTRWSALDSSGLELRYLREETYNLAFRPLSFG